MQQFVTLMSYINMKKRIRLFNCLIDSSVFYILVLLISVLLKEHIERATLKYSMILFYYLYYLIFEFTFGQTIGKMITKTKVIDIESGKKPSFSRIFMRTLSRLIPIDFLSYLFSSNGIHDILSKTELKRV
jgi:uncharacterized RDD family membrane protein YckC